MGAHASSFPTVDQQTNSSSAGQNERPSQQRSMSNFAKQLSIRRSKKRRNHERFDSANGGGSPPSASGTGPSAPPISSSALSTAPEAAAAALASTQTSSLGRDRPRRMDRLRSTLRSSLRRRHYGRDERELQHVGMCDEKLVREGNCCFRVKYLGCIQVYESRGMQVCEDAIKVLRSQRRRTLRCVLHVSGQSLRVVADDTKNLLVDQTIEKVSFCAPDRNIERGFSYICRDGTTRRWMCHCFMAIGESGERLSHAVGCAFAVCLERKQQRDKECTVSMSVDPSTAAFTRYGSFRHTSLADRLVDPQDCKPAEPVPVKPAENPFAVERPRAPASLFARQGSLRIPGPSNGSGARGEDPSEPSPFKRQFSLRIDQLPSNKQRQQLQKQHQQQLQEDLSKRGPGIQNRMPLTRPSATVRTVEPIVELSDLEEADPCDNVTLLCRELSNGLQTRTMTLSDPSANNSVGADDWLCSITNSVMAGTKASQFAGGNGSARAHSAICSSQGLDSAAASTCSSTTEGAAPSPLPHAPHATAPAVALPHSQSHGTIGDQWTLESSRHASNPFLDSGVLHSAQKAHMAPANAVKAFELNM